MKKPPPSKEDGQTRVRELRAEKRDRAQRVAKAILECTAAPPMTLTLTGDTLKIAYEADEVVAVTLQMADMGTSDRDFHQGLIQQIATVGARAVRADSTNSNFVLSVVRSVEPRDELEAMLATQMGAIHIATMMLARRLNHVDTIQQQDAAERALNKLARTFAMQIAALKHYRTGGQQKVTVEHVTVNAGGQAIVGAVVK